MKLVVRHPTNKHTRSLHAYEARLDFCFSHHLKKIAPTFRILFLALFVSIPLVTRIPGCLKSAPQPPTTHNKLRCFLFLKNICDFEYLYFKEKNRNEKCAAPSFPLPFLMKWRSPLLINPTKILEVAVLKGVRFYVKNISPFYCNGPQNAINEIGVGGNKESFSLNFHVS